MGIEETDVTNRILIRLSALGVVLFRNVRGLFLTPDGKRKVKAGLMAEGSSDLIGFTPTLITEDMIGQIIPIFTVIEVKTTTGAVMPNQKKFIAFIKSKNGIAGVARSPEDAAMIIQNKNK